MPEATTFLPVAGSITVSRTLRTADSLISAMFAPVVLALAGLGNFLSAA
jgi:phosphoribosylcarboxyaminoimidazole (NCAIR) mutase